MNSRIFQIRSKKENSVHHAKWWTISDSHATSTCYVYKSWHVETVGASAKDDFKYDYCFIC